MGCMMPQGLSVCEIFSELDKGSSIFGVDTSWTPLYDLDLRAWRLRPSPCTSSQKELPLSSHYDLNLGIRAGRLKHSLSRSFYCGEIYENS